MAQNTQDIIELTKTGVLLKKEWLISGSKGNMQKWTRR